MLFEFPSSNAIKDTFTMTLAIAYFPLSNIGRRAFVFYAPRKWNSLPESLRKLNSLDSFKRDLKTYLFSDFADFVRKYNKFNNLLII